MSVNPDVQDQGDPDSLVMNDVAITDMGSVASFAGINAYACKVKFARRSHRPHFDITAMSQTGADMTATWDEPQEEGGYSEYNALGYRVRRGYLKPNGYSIKWYPWSDWQDETSVSWNGWNNNQHESSTHHYAQVYACVEYSLTNQSYVSQGATPISHRFVRKGGSW